MNSNNDPSIEEVLQEKDSEKQKQKYNDYVSNITPKSNRFLNCAKAFLVGGAICVVGEGFNSLYQYLGNDKELAGLYTTLSLILLSIILTGLNIYQKLGQFGGAGSIVPITGFANSVVSPAIEFQAEGQVFGIGCKIFTIAGPVILYGIFCSWVVGVIYWLLWKFFLCFKRVKKYTRKLLSYEYIFLKNYFRQKNRGRDSLLLLPGLFGYNDRKYAIYWRKQDKR